MTNTFLLGGEFIVFVLLSFIDIGNVMSASKEYGTFSQVMCSISDTIWVYCQSDVDDDL